MSDADLCIFCTCRFKTLDVKYILLESMSHHILPSLVSSLEWDALDTMLREIVKFHDDYRREAAELVIQAYNHGTYTKVGIQQYIWFASLKLVRLISDEYQG